VDVWNIHPYVGTKATVQLELDDLRNQLSGFRDWMASVGEQDKPLIITELLPPHRARSSSPRAIACERWGSGSWRGPASPIRIQRVNGSGR
jgi:hypothetical protein